MKISAPFNRRQFLFDASRFAALDAFAGAIPFPTFAAPSANDPRISQTPIADAGYAAVHKIGDGLYATISDTSKGYSTICNGGFLIGKETGLLLEGFGSPSAPPFRWMPTARPRHFPQQARCSPTTTSITPWATHSMAPTASRSGATPLSPSA